MFRLRTLLLCCSLALGVPGLLSGQDAPPQGPPPVFPVVDSLTVEGNLRITSAQIITNSGLLIGKPTNYRDLQRAITSLFRTGQFDDVTIQQAESDSTDNRPGVVLLIRVRERPLLQRWAFKGTEKITARTLKEKVKLSEGRPIDRAAVERGRGAIDSIYRAQGYYAASVKVIETQPMSGQVNVIYDINEGSRVAISQVQVEGNPTYSDKQLVKKMSTKPEGFFWWQRGRYEDDKLQADMREKLPNWYGSNGYIDFQVTADSISVDTAHGKAILHLAVEEGQAYKIGGFQIIGNRRFSTEELTAMYPFGPGDGTGKAFNSVAWSDAATAVKKLYSNNGYIYAQINPEEIRRVGPDGAPLIDLRWSIREGQPATINKINIVGNDVTHERVVRDAIVLAPGQLYNEDRLIQSYRNIANLGFFQQPMPFPDVKPTDNNVDVDITFRVEERRTGNINFGASLGQGTGLGGFLGLEEPNLFGRGKRGKLLWQFGRNINDFTLSYTDPAIQESRISGTVTLFNSRQRFTVGDLGRRRQVGGSVQLGFPFFGSRFTRVYTSYGLQQIKFTGGSQDLRERFKCTNCTRSTVGGSIVRDTRFGLPFATGGAMTNVALELNGGVLGGTGDYRKIDFETRYYAPLGSMGGNEQLGSGVQFVLGLTAKSGFIFGDPGPFFTEMYSLGGTQFGIPLRGYDEFSITPDGFDPAAGGSQAAGSNAFGKAYAAFTVEAGARVSQSLYFSTFLDAGNVYRTPSQYDPSRLFRGAGFGVAVLSPLGPIGIDLGYGFDKVTSTGKPDPGWQLHFKLGQFF
jgi:outer membrane protein insertion porin family